MAAALGLTVSLGWLAGGGGAAAAPAGRPNILFIFYDDHCGQAISAYGPSHVKGETYNLWELCDLEKDPHELRSVYDDPAYAEVRAELHKELRSSPCRPDRRSCSGPGGRSSRRRGRRG